MSRQQTSAAVHRYFLRLHPLMRGRPHLPTGAVTLVNPHHIVRVTSTGRTAGVLLVTGERLLVDAYEFKEQLELYHLQRKGSCSCD